MNPRIIKKPRAEQDLIEHFEFIARDKVPAAERFLAVAQKTIESIAGMPMIGRRWEFSKPHLANIRVYPMPSGFRNYLVFYRPIDYGIELLAVLHGARDLASLLDSLVDDSSQ
jgi:toxin ParE1/3/4